MRLVRGWPRIGATIALAASIWLGGRVPAALALGQAQVSAGSMAVGQGLTGTVDVMVKDVAELYAADIQLRFDPAVLQVVDADPATGGVQVQLGDFLDRGLSVRNAADNTAGTVWFAVTQLNPSEPKSGQGRLFSVIFRGGKAGARSEIAIESAVLATRDGETIPVTLVNGESRVVSQEQAPATPTTAPVVRPTLVLPPVAADEPSLVPPVASTPAAGAATTKAPSTISGPASTSVLAASTPTTATKGPTAPPLVPGQVGEVNQATTAAGETAVATWTFPAQAVPEATFPAPVQSEDGGRGAPRLWVIGLIIVGAIVVVWVVIRAKGAGR